MSKKLPNVIYTLGFSENGKFYTDDRYNGTYRSIDEAKKVASRDDLEDVIIFELRPVSQSVTKKIEWQDVESR